MKNNFYKAKFSRFFPIFMAVILLMSALMPYVSAEEYGIETWYVNLITNRTGGTINSTMTWSGDAYSDCIDVSATYMIHENRLIFNGSDDPVAGGSSTVSTLLDSGAVVNSGTGYTTEIRNNGDTYVHIYERATGCHSMFVRFNYTIDNKDFVTKQEMNAYGYAVFESGIIRTCLYP